MEQEEMVVDGPILGEEQIEPFDWEDYLYELWLEEKRGHKRNRQADAGV